MAKTQTPTAKEGTYKGTAACLYLSTIHPSQQTSQDSYEASRGVCKAKHGAHRRCHLSPNIRLVLSRLHKSYAPWLLAMVCLRGLVLVVLSRRPLPLPIVGNAVLLVLIPC
jgi:hypothetical protein